jgi:hypothetical protein
MAFARLLVAVFSASRRMRQNFEPFDINRFAADHAFADQMLRVHKTFNKKLMHEASQNVAFANPSLLMVSPSAGELFIGTSPDIQVAPSSFSTLL